jgi:hypothetical protein
MAKEKAVITAKKAVAFSIEKMINQYIFGEE